MQDLKHRMNENGLFEIARKGGDFETVDGFESAILVSLFTNARRDESEVSDPIRRGGWIGNWRTAKKKRQLGGECAKIERDRLTVTLLNEARDAASNSLRWMIEDGICRDIEVSAQAVNQNSVQYSITITTRDGVKYDYIYLWDRTDAFTHSATFNA